MTMRNYKVRFGPVDVQAVSQADAVDAAVTLIRYDPGFYRESVVLHEGNEDGEIADTPPDERTGTV